MNPKPFTESELNDLHRRAQVLRMALEDKSECVAPENKTEWDKLLRLEVAAMNMAIHARGARFVSPATQQESPCS